jgi:hypothetical protein
MCGPTGSAPGGRPTTRRPGKPTSLSWRAAWEGGSYERTSDGVEHDWGEVTVWEPPARLVYLWHLRRDRADATEVEIRFIAQGTTAARIEIEHRGWERLGGAAGEWRERNRAGWQTLLPHYLAAIQEQAVTGKGDNG